MHATPIESANSICVDSAQILKNHTMHTAFPRIVASLTHDPGFVCTCWTCNDPLVMTVHVSVDFNRIN